MPFYDYHCVSCGCFRELRPLADSSKPQLCPDCSEPAERMFMAPFLAGKGQQNNRSRSNILSCGHGAGCSHSRFAWPRG